MKIKRKLLIRLSAIDNRTVDTSVSSPMPVSVCTSIDAVVVDDQVVVPCVDKDSSGDEQVKPDVQLMR